MGAMLVLSILSATIAFANMMMELDADPRVGVGLLWIRARPQMMVANHSSGSSNNTTTGGVIMMAHITGAFRTGGGLTPVLLWSRNSSAKWSNPCAAATNAHRTGAPSACCLAEAVRVYRNDRLAAAINVGNGSNISDGRRTWCPSSNNASVALTRAAIAADYGNEFITGSVPGAAIVPADSEGDGDNEYGYHDGVRLFTAVVPQVPESVTMLFMGWDPFFWTVGFTQPVLARILVPPPLRSSSNMTTAQCHNVTVPNRPFQICMYCSNAKPNNSRFVWTPNWFVNMHCLWACTDDYEGSMCQSKRVVTVVPYDSAPPLWTILVISASVALVFIAILVISFTLLPRGRHHRGGSSVAPSHEDDAPLLVPLFPSSIVDSGPGVFRGGEMSRLFSSFKMESSDLYAMANHGGASPSPTYSFISGAHSRSMSPPPTWTTSSSPSRHNNNNIHDVGQSSSPSPMITFRDDIISNNQIRIKIS
jgi:hypothetical protein